MSQVNLYYQLIYVVYLILYTADIVCIKRHWLEREDKIKVNKEKPLLLTQLKEGFYHQTSSPLQSWKRLFWQYSLRQCSRSVLTTGNCSVLSDVSKYFEDKIKHTSPKHVWERVYICVLLETYKGNQHLKDSQKSCIRCNFVISEFLTFFWERDSPCFPLQIYPTKMPSRDQLRKCRQSNRYLSRVSSSPLDVKRLL